MADDGARIRELFTASEVARFCQVDLKTIHNWAERGEVRHFRTPGRHLRFRPVDVLDFLRKYGYPIPDALRTGRPRVHVLDADGASAARIQRTLAKRFEVTTFRDPVDALIAVGSGAPDALVLDVKLSAFDGVRCLARLKQLPATRHVRCVVFSGQTDARKKALDAGATAFVAKPDVVKLRETLEAALGLEPTPSLSAG